MIEQEEKDVEAQIILKAERDKLRKKKGKQRLASKKLNPPKR